MKATVVEILFSGSDAMRDYEKVSCEEYYTMTRAKEYYIFIEYPFQTYGFTLDSQIERIAPLSYCGSGAGFGERDHSFHTLSKSKALDIAGRLKALNVKGARVTTKLYTPGEEYTTVAF